MRLVATKRVLRWLAINLVGTYVILNWAVKMQSIEHVR